METYQDPYPPLFMDSDFDWSDFNWSDFNLRYLGLTFDSASSLFPFPFYNNHVSPPRHKAHLIPVEIFSEIFLYMVQADPRSRVKLMLVCRQWHAIMLSTPGIHSQLRIRSNTWRKEVERFGRMWLLDVTIDWSDPVFGWIHNPGRFFVSFMVATQAASRWRSLEFLTFPPTGAYKNLQIVLSLQHLETFKLAPSCNLGNLLKPLMTTVATTVTPRLTVMEVLHPDAVPYLVQPAHFQIFSSLTTLRLICRRMQNPVDILPHLHKLRTFEAHRLFLPIYSPIIDLPMIQTLHVLRLKSVSVQWLAGRIFPALEECFIIFPHHADAIQSVYMPSCFTLKYDSNNLGTIERFHLPTLARLDVKCDQWQAWNGNIQLATLHPIFASQSLTCLHLQIKCSERLLVHMLGLVPALEELWMGLSSPHALSSAFFLAFAAGGCNTTAKIGTPSQAIPPLCKELKRLHLHYKRWLRGPERNELIRVFSDVVASHQHWKPSGFSLYLSFDGGSEEEIWRVCGKAEKWGTELEDDVGTNIGLSTLHGIVTLSTSLVSHCPHFQHFKELGYITSHGTLDPPIDHFLPFHNLKELRIPGSFLRLQPNTPLPTNFPFFYTLKVLKVASIESSFIAGQTFHNLERYGELFPPCESNTGLLTEMPVCTRLVVELSRLACLRLPQICELSVYIDGEGSYGEEFNGEGPNMVWEKHVAVNSNLSGLKLLHFFDPIVWEMPERNIIQILRSVPALETLIIDNSYIETRCVEFFKAFVPFRAQKTDVSSGEGQISGVLCPKLQSLQIEGICVTEQPELMSVLKDMVTLRAIIGSPLKSFTFNVSYAAPKNSKHQWELIGKDGRFTLEEVVPVRGFVLDI